MTTPIKINKLRNSTAIPSPFLTTFFKDEVWFIQNPSQNDVENISKLKWPSHEQRDSTTCSILRDSKILLLSIIFNTRDGKEIPAAGQVVAFHQLLKQLIIWAWKEEFRTLAEVNSSNVTRYIDYLHTKRKKASGEKLKNSTIAKHLNCIAEYYAYSDCVTNKMKTDPLSGVSCSEYANHQETDIENHPATPIEIAAPLIIRSIALIDQVGFQALEKTRSLESEGLTHSMTIPISMKYYKYTSEDLYTASLSARTLGDLYFIITMCFAAAAIVITYLTGMRRSELLGLEVSCLTKKRKTSRLPAHCIIKGRIIKQRTNISQFHENKKIGTPHEWIAPSDVANALKFLELLSKRDRELQSTNYLWPTASTLPGHRETYISNAAAGQFKRLSGAIHKLPLFLDIECNGWLINISQARKTLSKFVSMRDKTKLYALSKQLGHMDSLVTEYGYSHFDLDLNEELEKAEFESIFNSWESILSSSTLSGTAGKTVHKMMMTYPGGYTKKNKHAYVKTMVDANFTVIPNDWSYCVFESGASKCNKGGSKPSETFKEPYLCSTCSNCCVTDRNFEYWHNLQTENKHLLKIANRNSQTYKLAEKRLENINSILNSMDSI